MRCCHHCSIHERDEGLSPLVIVGKLLQVPLVLLRRPFEKHYGNEYDKYVRWERVCEQSYNNPDQQLPEIVGAAYILEAPLIRDPTYCSPYKVDQ